MKARVAPKSKFIYPDKLYARCKDNKTLDMSYAPQDMESIEYTRTDAFIEKACEWLINHNDYICGSTNGIVKYDMKQLVEDFKKYMEG